MVSPCQNVKISLAQVINIYAADKTQEYQTLFFVRVLSTSCSVSPVSRLQDTVMRFLLVLDTVGDGEESREVVPPAPHFGEDTGTRYS